MNDRKISFDKLINLKNVKKGKIFHLTSVRNKDGWTIEKYSPSMEAFFKNYQRFSEERTRVVGKLSDLSIKYSKHLEQASILMNEIQISVSKLWNISQTFFSKNTYTSKNDDFAEEVSQVNSLISKINTENYLKSELFKSKLGNFCEYWKEENEELDKVII